MVQPCKVYLISRGLRGRLITALPTRSPIIVYTQLQLKHRARPVSYLTFSLPKEKKTAILILKIPRQISQKHRVCRSPCFPPLTANLAAGLTRASMSRMYFP